MDAPAGLGQRSRKGTTDNGRARLGSPERRMSKRMDEKGARRAPNRVMMAPTRRREVFFPR